ncbi:MAG: hypothetical protein IJU07_07100, partial [Synergistaceae bacterium]|nr:hypothetical protein [Synergistaceae bacterium]
YVFLNYLRCHDDIGWGLDYDYLRTFSIDEVAHKKFLNDYFKGDFRGSPSRGETYNDAPELGDARMCGTTASLCGLESGNKDMAVKLDIMLHAFLFTQSGIPVLYSGDEIGQLNDYSYHDSPDPDKAADSRYVHRGAFHWEDAEKRDDLSTPQGKIFNAVRKLMTLRDTQAVFANEADTWLVETGNNHVLGIGRYYGEKTQKEKMLAFFNFSDESQTFRTNENLGGIFHYRNMITGDEFTGNSNVQVTLEGYGFLWLLADL